MRARWKSILSHITSRTKPPIASKALRQLACAHLVDYEFLDQPVALPPIDLAAGRRELGIALELSEDPLEVAR